MECMQTTTKRLEIPMSSTRLEIKDGHVVRMEISDGVDDLIRRIIDSAVDNEGLDAARNEISFGYYVEQALQESNLEATLAVVDHLILEVERRW